MSANIAGNKFLEVPLPTHFSPLSHFSEYLQAVQNKTILRRLNFEKGT
jgi:hypothetical protein